MVSVNEILKDDQIRSQKKLPPYNREANMSVNDIVEALCDSPDACLEEINQRIARLEENLKRLKRVQKMLGHSSGGKRDAAAYDASLVQSVEKVVLKHGPIRAKDVASKLGNTNYTLVGRIAAQSKLIHRRSDGMLEKS